MTTIVKIVFCIKKKWSSESHIKLNKSFQACHLPLQLRLESEQLAALLKMDNLLRVCLEQSTRRLEISPQNKDLEKKLKHIRATKWSMSSHQKGVSILS
jgi:hypothetical protein